MAAKPVQSAPNFNTGSKVPVPAHLYYVQAKQAYAANQWQQVCALAQACIAAARHDEQLRFLAKELLAVGLTKVSQFEQALAVFFELHQLKPNDAVVINNVGLALMHLQRYTDAIKCFQRAVELTSENVEFHMNLGLAFYKNRDFAHAKLSYQTVERLAPKHLSAKFGIAWTLQAEGHLNEAMIAYERVLELEPSYLMALSNMIFIHHCFYPFDLSRQTELVRRFGLAIGDLSSSKTNTGPAKLQLHTPLRVGIVSADLCHHVVCRFLESTFEQLTLNAQLRHKLTLVAYSNQSVQDEHTLRLSKQFDLWRRVDEWNDDVLIAQIKQDNIDILIDLSGHTQGNRLSVFAKKPAPLQISWLGYWGSTGLSSMDYVLADPVSVPTSEDGLFIEKIWRLPHLRYCFSTPENAPQVSSPPCIRSSAFVFGCYQASIKINDGVLASWSKILEYSPNARLRIQSLDFAKDELKKRFVERMVQVGLDINRVDLVGGMSTKEYLASYTEVDILLDTFPYPGGTTTAEALWMGVPTLTFTTMGMLGRQGEAMLVNAGLSDWVAYSEEEYVQKAIAWGNANLPQRQSLARLRAGMREQVRQSPVFNAKQFAGEFVDALYGMWREKCEL